MKLKTGTVYAYYDFPIVFSATSDEGSVFVCLIAEETDLHLRYLCKEVSPSTLVDLENNRRDIRSVFAPPGNLYSLCLNAGSEDLVEALETFEDITPFLPEEGFFIGPTGKSRTAQDIAMPMPVHSTDYSYDFALPAYYASSPSPRYQGKATED